MLSGSHDRQFTPLALLVSMKGVSLSMGVSR